MTRRRLQGSPVLLGAKAWERRNRRCIARRPTLRAYSAAIAVACSTAVVSSAASEEPALCADILYLIEQSRSQFLAIRGASGSEHGGHEATFALPEASYCVVLHDAEKGSYQCTWTHALGDKRAHDKFQRLVGGMGACLADIAGERKDQPVNHPDSYAAYAYRYPGGEARVSLKTKSQLVSTLVSIGLDGFAKTE